MKGIKIGPLLKLNTALLLLFSAIIAQTGIIFNQSTLNTDSEIIQKNMTSIYEIGEFKTHLEKINVTYKNIVIYSLEGDLQKVDEQKATTAQYINDINDKLINFSDLDNDDVNFEYSDFTNILLNEFIPCVNDIVNYSFDGDVSAALVLMAEAAANTEELEALLNESLEANLTWARDAQENSKSLSFMASIIQGGAWMLSMIIGLVIAMYLKKHIIDPVEKMEFVLSEIAQGNFNVPMYSSNNNDEIGSLNRNLYKVLETIKSLIGELSYALKKISEQDLDIHITQEYEGDFNIIKESVNLIAENLNQVMREINTSSTQVADSSYMISKDSQNLLKGSAAQTTYVRDLTILMDSVSEKTKNNAEQASRAAMLANTIKGNAEKGSCQMNEMMNAVKEINEASQSISKVIKVIDDIAFQTNILALNAAVEAARAGQHGKGFSIVAEEVRNLAAKSAEAAKDTGNLIVNSMEKAELGKRIAGETAASLADIVSGINESTQIVNDIAQSSGEQSEGIAKINHGIDQVAEIVQQNSTAATDSAAAAEEMSGQSRTLDNLIAQFKLKDINMVQRNSNK